MSCRNCRDLNNPPPHPSSPRLHFPPPLSPSSISDMPAIMRQKLRRNRIPNRKAHRQSLLPQCIHHPTTHSLNIYHLVACISPLLLLHLAAPAALLRLSLLAHAQPSQTPSSMISSLLDPKYNNLTASSLLDHRLSSFMACNNSSSSPSLLNDDQGLYGRCTNVSSAHYHLPYTVYFQLCFVVRSVATAAAGEEGVCLGSGATYYLSMVAMNKTPDGNKGQIIWTANTGKPVSKNSCLQLGDDDKNLKLVECGNGSSSPQVVWETNTKLEDRDAMLAITSEGDLVLFRMSPFVLFWQSHQHPTDILMVLQVLQKNSILSVENNLYSRPPHSGNYTMVIERRCLKLYARIGWHGGDYEEIPYGSPYWVWCDTSSSFAADEDEISFISLCSYPNASNQLELLAGYGSLGNDTEIPPEICSSAIDNGVGLPILEIKVSEAPTNVTYATFLRLEADGDLRAYTVNDTTYLNSAEDSNSSTAVWSSFYSVFEDMPCELPLYCGFYGQCDQQNKDRRCTCHDGFEFNDILNVRLGCKLRSGNLPTDGSVCTSDRSKNVRFAEIGNVHYFSVNFTEPEFKQGDRRQCLNSCQQDCNCTAAFFDDGSGSCFLIRGQVGTIRKGTMVALIKYVLIGVEPSHDWQEIGPALAVATVTLVVACIYLYRRRRALEMRYAELEKERLLLSLLSSNVPPQ